MTDQPTERHPLALVVMLVIIAGSVGGALYMMRRADARAQAADATPGVSAIPVDISEIRRVDVPLVIEARGFLSGFAEVTVHSEVAGRVLSREVDDGDPVQAGDVLLRIDGTFYTLRVRQAEAELHGARARLSEADAQVRQAEAQLQSVQAAWANKSDEFQRIDDLYKSGNSPQIEYDRMATAFRMAEADLAAAKAALARTADQRVMAGAAVQTAEAVLNESQAYLERCVVRSPITGRVNRFALEAGEYAVTTAPLVEVVRLDKLKMIIELTDRQAVLLDRSTRAEVTADVADDRRHRAELHHVAPKVDPVTKKFRVELHVENADESLLAGMYGQARLECGTLADVIRIPRQSVFKHFGADFCLVVEPDGGREKARLRRVVTRDLTGYIDEIEVVSGLGEGDRVIRTRRPELREGTLVTVARTVAVAAPDPQS